MFDEKQNEDAKRAVKAVKGDRKTVVKTERLDVLENHFDNLHGNALSVLKSLLDVVPTTQKIGNLCGFETQWMTERREGLERDLAVVRGLRDSQLVKICAVQVGEEPMPGEGEILQTTTVPLSEVRKELPAWKEAMMKEYNSLVHETRAIEPVELSSLQPEKTEFVPGKLVTVRKAGPQGGKKKCRAVVCGNLLQSELDPAPSGLYASGADGVLIRANLAYSVQRGWGIGTTDIRTAFLLAPRPKDQNMREVIVVPPRIMVEAGVCSSTERWRVHNALYGFTSSPAHWAVHRDRTMANFEWTWEGDQFFLERTEEGNLWKIMKRSPQSKKPVCEGHVIVYVDDIMALSTDGVRESFFNRLGQEWNCAEVETVNQTDWLRFCGFELKRHEDQVSLMVGQRSYTAELLKRHDDVTPRSFPMPKLDGVETVEETPTQSEIKRAQAVTGELLWLSVRSRPDISYAISIMSRHVLKKPKWVQDLGRHVLGFLKNTPETCLVYSPCSQDHGPYGTLQVPRHNRLLEAFADISFNPQGERSHQGIILCVGGTPIQWEATRQAFHTMSTAESELVGYCEATTMLKSAEALMMVIHGVSSDDMDGFEKIIYGDNSSALSILMNPDGGWRTRHLRLRSSCLRELLKTDPQNWKVRHQKGTDLPADMLTKPIVLLRDWIKFWHFLGFHVDMKTSKGHDLNESTPPVEKTDEKPTCPGPEFTEGREAGVQKIKVAATMAAMAAASAAANGPKLRIACAVTAAACAGWLVSGSRLTKMKDSGEMVQELSGVEKKDNKNLERRAIGLKKVSKIGEENCRVEQGSQGKMNLSSQNGKQYGIFDEFEPPEGDTGRFFGIEGVGPQTGLIKGTPNDVAGQCSGQVQLVQSFESSSHVIEDSSRPKSAVYQYYCPWGCPETSYRPRLKAMSFSNGMNYVDETGGEIAVRNGPWMMSKFSAPPPGRSQDQWQYLEHEGHRYWIKVHHGFRARRFHPVHRGQPMEVEQLASWRMTVMFPGGSGPPQRVLDKWMDSSGEKKDRWTGYTFFEMKPKYTTSEGLNDGPWKGATENQEDWFRGSRPMAESPSRVYSGGKGYGSGGPGSPSVVVYVNNHAGAANPPLIEQQVRSEGAFEDHALGKASGKAHQRGLTVLSQGSAAGTVRATTGLIRHPSSDGWSHVSDVEEN